MIPYQRCDRTLMHYTFIEDVNQHKNRLAAMHADLKLPPLSSFKRHSIAWAIYSNPHHDPWNQSPFACALRGELYRTAARITCTRSFSKQNVHAYLLWILIFNDQVFSSGRTIIIQQAHPLPLKQKVYLGLHRDCLAVS